MSSEKSNALAKLAGALAMFRDFHKVDDRVNGHVLTKAQRIVAELAKVEYLSCGGEVVSTVLRSKKETKGDEDGK